MSNLTEEEQKHLDEGALGDDENKRDGAVARKRLAEAKRDPSKLVRGKALEDELARLES